MSVTEIEEYTREELESMADELAMDSSLHTSGREALKMIQEGALAGTLLASRLTQLYFLIEGE